MGKIYLSRVYAYDTGIPTIGILDGYGNKIAISKTNVTNLYIEDANGNINTKIYAARSFSYIVTKYLYSFKAITDRDQLHQIPNIDFDNINNSYYRGITGIVSKSDFVNSNKYMTITNPYTNEIYLCITLFKNKKETYFIAKIVDNNADIVYTSSDKEQFNNNIVFEIIFNNYTYPYHRVEDPSKIDTYRFIAMKIYEDHMATLLLRSSLR